MKKLNMLLLQNKAWAKGRSEIDEGYFGAMSESQSPDILWIGCSDSRVPPDEVINTRPGSLFVHRNIANLVYEDDENLMSVIEYAVKYLKVKYIILCGHYGCGGVKAAMDGIDNPRLSKWTRMVAEVKTELKSNPSSLDKDKQELDLLVEKSVLRQVENLKKLDVVKDSWASTGYPKIAGWVYDLKTGLINHLSLYEHHPE